MDTTQLVEQVEFGLSLLRLARAVSDQPLTESKELEDEFQKTAPVRKRRVS
jgi:hypothetical protein